MLEDKKIEELIQEYKNFFDNTNADVCRTLKGIWYFQRYDEKYNSFDCFIRFSTADELKQIILTELADDMNIALQSTAGELMYRHENLDKCIDVKNVSNIGSSIEELMINIEAINSQMKSLTGVFSAMQGVCSE